MSFPWLWPYSAPATTACDWGSLPAGNVASQLNARRNGLALQGVPLFVHSTESLGAMAYERHVHAGQIPTRDIAHDWYNGLVWLHFSQAKHWINASHVEDAGLQFANTSNGRSRFRDALTLFDESGAVLLTTDVSLLDALLMQDWKTLFVKDREHWQQRACLMVFGHGLLDSLHHPHPGLCAKAVPVLVPSLEMEPVNLGFLVRKLVAEIQDPANFSPVPVMGVPGWFEVSDSPGFYNDRSVYRAKPTPKHASSHERLAFKWDESTLALGKCVGQSLPDSSGGGKSGLQ